MRRAPDSRRAFAAPTEAPAADGGGRFVGRGPTGGRLDDEARRSVPLREEPGRYRAATIPRAAAHPPTSRLASAAAMSSGKASGVHAKVGMSSAANAAACRAS